MDCCSAQQHSCTATGFASTKHQLFRENWLQQGNRCTKENRERITLNIFIFCLLEIFKGRKSLSITASCYFFPYKLILLYPFIHVIAPQIRVLLLQLGWFIFNLPLPSPCVFGTI